MIPVWTDECILPKWRGTPISDLLAYHNLERPFRSYERAELAVAMCMDHRKSLRIPDDFAYVLRTGGGNPSRVEFEISFAVAVKGIRALALIAHDDCGMVGLSGRRDAFVEGLVEAGWVRGVAEAYFDTHAPSSEVADPVEFVRTQALSIQAAYPSVTVAPLFYSVGERLLYQI